MKLMKIVLLGPPGSGKGTYGGEISKKFGIPLIGSGQMYRDEVAKGTELGKKVEPILKAGQLVPDDITINMMKKRLEEDDAKKGFILDGFPRTLAQAEALDKITGLDIVLNLNVPREILMEKMLARRTCLNCGAIYNLADIDKVINGVHYKLPPLLPKKDGICDKCGSKIEQRSDETPEIIEQRFVAYDKLTAPLIRYYEKRGILINVNVSAGKEIMVEKIIKILEEKMAKNH